MVGLIGAMRAIFWGMMLLTFALLVWAVIGVQFIHPLNLRIAATGFYDDCERCPRAYGSVGQSLTTLLQQNVAGDAWAEVTVPIIEHYPAAGLYFIGVMMTVSMALLNLILGVVVNIAMQSRDDLQAEMEQEKAMHRINVHHHLQAVCNEMDTDGSGELSRTELLKGYKENEPFRDTLNELDIQEEDLEVLWAMLDSDKDGSVPYTTFIVKSYEMKSSVTQFMLAYIKYYVTRIKDQICEILTHEKNEMESLQRLEQDELRHELVKIEQEEEQLAKGINSIETSTPIAQKVPDKEDKAVAPTQEADTMTTTDGSQPLNVFMRLSLDDRQILDNLTDNLRQWRQELQVDISGISSKMDQQVPQKIVMQNMMQSPQQPDAIQSWCCSRDPSALRSGAVGLIAPRSMEDAVVPMEALRRTPNENLRVT